MAKLSSDKKYVTVEWGDTLTQIAVDYAGGYSKYKTLAAINDIPNPNLIYVGQKIYLSKSSASSATSASSTPTKATIVQFGHQSNADNTLFATWKWSRSNTESYKVLWTYSTGDGVYFVGSNSTITVDADASPLSRQSTYNIPSNAIAVKFKVKPISKTYKKNDKDVNYWTAGWSSEKIWTDSTPLTTPSAPSVEVKTNKLIATLDNLDIEDATHIQFRLVRDNKTVVKTTGATEIAIKTGHASYTFTIDPGHEYKVCCRAYDNNGKSYSEWSGYSGNTSSAPKAPSKITSIKAISETSVYLEWNSSATAETYDIQYTTDQTLFETNSNSGLTTTSTEDDETKFIMQNLESGKEYFFRVRAKKGSLTSDWSAVSSIIIGTKPAPPTTWSSTTTAIAGENVYLYWVHNTEDGSSQTGAILKLTITNGTNVVTKEITINTDVSNDEDTEDSSVCTIDTVNGALIYGDSEPVSLQATFVEGVHIDWQVRTKGITGEFSDWSSLRTIDIYTQPELGLSIWDTDSNIIDTVTTFPFRVYALASPKTQTPTGYHLSVISDESYDTVDVVGNELTINAGDTVYSKFFDTTDELLVEMSAGNIDLANNINYTVTCTVSMNSGLTATATTPFTVSWVEVSYVPNAEIGIDEDTYAASIRPYCETGALINYLVTKSGSSYIKSTNTVDQVYGELVSGALTTTGERVYSGVSADGDEIYYCTVEQKETVGGVLMSVYRREFDGSFTEIATDIDSSKNTYVTDPHPALDYARYRIVATDVATGTVSYYDMPGYAVGGKAVIIQWDEEWSSFDTEEDATLEQPEWSGSLLKLPYNIDVSDNTKPDVSLIEYIGRTHPVSYYGTHVGQSASWNVEIEKSDKETIYALRRLARWMGDVYVREPSGSGYWANITVSFSQKHCDLIVPVSLNITRVEGGV